jgi:transposase
LFDAQTHHFEQARCKLCGAIVRADGTEAITQSGLGSSYITYDFSACAMLLVMHYFAGVPFKRLESLQAGWGIPMPDANQWSLADASADLLFPLYKALERHGVQNALALRIDDTGSMVIEVRSEIRKEVAALEALGESSKHVRTGINATGVYLDTEQGKVLLFFTGRHHAGEIIDQILQHRQARQSKLVKVSDAASKNFCHGYKDELQEAVCNAHAYLKFRAVKNEHPEAYSLCGEVYKKVFANDDVAKADGMSPEQRMLYHRKHSLPQMKRLEAMCREKLASKLVEPNAPLWEPITFIINQWDRLTTFCHVPGVPLDSNVVEQMLIIPVRYLAASFNYKTQNGADVGDRHMSLIATANANGVEPVAYLTECLENHEDLAKRPEHYLPWVYRERCEKGDRSIKDDRPSATVEHPLRPGTTRAPPANATRPPFTSAAGPRPRFDKTYKHYATFPELWKRAGRWVSPPEQDLKLARQKWRTRTFAITCRPIAKPALRKPFGA